MIQKLKNTLKYTLIFGLILVSYQLTGQQVLTQLPFGIKIGTTTNEELEDKGTCVQKNEEESSCQLYDMAGNFFVYSSQNQVVNKVRFSAVEGNKLPRKWVELGLEFTVENKPGTLDIDFMNIIKGNGAKYIESSREYNENKEVRGISFSFEIESLSYAVSIRTDAGKENLLGLYEIVITEAY